LNTDIPKEDKEGIRRLLLKPWNPYVFRHSALTRMAGVLKESSLRQIAGWTKTSNMPQVYYFAQQAGNELLQAKGYLPPNNETNVLTSKFCGNCKEPNKPDAKYCIGGVSGCLPMMHLPK
jgi:hypothetical protein